VSESRAHAGLRMGGEEPPARSVGERFAQH
jgi:hypothetical protein